MNTALDRIDGKIDGLFTKGRLNSQEHLDLEAERARLWREAKAQPNNCDVEDIIKASEWVSIRYNEAKTYFSALDKPFLEHTVNLEVIVGVKVLVNGELFHSRVIPTVEEALEFSRTLCDE